MAAASTKFLCLCLAFFVVFMAVSDAVLDHDSEHEEEIVNEEVDHDGKVIGYPGMGKGKVPCNAKNREACRMGPPSNKYTRGCKNIYRCKRTPAPEDQEDQRHEE